MAIDVRWKHKVVRIISVYNPHAGYSWNDFIENMDALSALCTQAQDHGYGLLIGGDFNLSWDEGSRGTVFRDFRDAFQLSVDNAIGAADSNSNWTFISSTGSLRRIDFILSSADLSMSDIMACNDIDLGSDH